MKRLLKIMALLILGVAALFVTAVILFPPCSGLRGCYHFLQAMKQKGGVLAWDRRNSISNFAASQAITVFSVPLDQSTRGLVVVGNADGRRRIIVDEGARIFYPNFSLDGERLFLVRTRAASAELLSCSVSDWQCQILVKANQPIRSPVEVDRDTVLYVTSPAEVRGDGSTRYTSHDFWVVKNGGDPERLTNFRLYTLDSVGIAGDEIFFWAAGAKDDAPIELVTTDFRAPQRSEIYSLRFDRSALRIHEPQSPLAQRFLTDGYSIRPSVSPRGDRVSFINTVVSLPRVGYRYDLMIADIDGSRPHRIELQGIALSSAAFVGPNIWFNEAFDDHYTIRQLDADLRPLSEIVLPADPVALRALEPIKLQIAPPVGKAAAG